MEKNCCFSGYHYKLADEQPSTASGGMQNNARSMGYQLSWHQPLDLHRDFVHGFLFRNQNKTILLMGEKFGGNQC